MENITVSGIVGLAVFLFVLVAFMTASVEVVTRIQRRIMPRSRRYTIVRVEGDGDNATVLVDGEGNILHVRWSDKK